MADFFSPQSPIFISHAWGDGTSKFVSHLKDAIEEHTLLNVWVDLLGINQVIVSLARACLCAFYFDLRVQIVDDVMRRFREALCASSVIIVCLTPTYFTRPNCIRELRWALDFAASGKKRVVLLPLHPAVTFGGVQKMLQPGSHRGLVFSSKDRSPMRIKPVALELLSHAKFSTQMTDVSKLPCHELQVTSRLVALIVIFVDQRWCRRGEATNSKTTGSWRGVWMQGREVVGRCVCEGQAAL